MKSKIIDWWMRSRFANKAKARRYILQQWNNDNIKPNAGTVREMLHGFEHIIEVDYYKIYESYNGFFGSRLYMDFQKQFCYPNRKLGEHSRVVIVRGIHTYNDDVFERNEFGTDATFVGTNCPFDATVIALKYK